MRRFLLLISFAVAVAACNSNSDTAENQSDTANHTNHNTANNTGGQNHMKAMHDAMM